MAAATNTNEIPATPIGPRSKGYHHKINAGPAEVASMRFAILLIPTYVFAANMPADLSAVRPGVITVAATSESLTLRWPDESSRTWIAEFSLDSAKPLIT